MSTFTSTRTRGRLRLVVERRGERSAVTCAEGHIPYAARVAPGRPGWARVVLVQTIAGPLAGDRATIDVEVDQGAALELVTNAATVALPCSSPAPAPAKPAPPLLGGSVEPTPLPARHELRCELAEEARLAWLPEPLILAAGCDLEAFVDVRLDRGAAAVTRELVVLGRHGEQPGRYRSSLRCELGGRPLLHDAVEIDAGGLAAGSAAILAGARACASVALLGIEPDDPGDPDELALAGPGRVLRALACDTASLRERLAAPEAAYLDALASSARR
jgi:urease accessory protein